jgi:hypothetical protein
MSDKKSEEIKDLPKKTPLTSSELEGVVGGLPKEGGGASDPHQTLTSAGDVVSDT